MKTLSIYEKSATGRMSSLNSEYPEISVLRVNGSTLVFNEQAKDDLRLEKESEILLARNEDGVYLANVTNNYRMGYKLSYASKNSRKSSDYLTVNCKTLINRVGLKKGIYLINGFAEYDENSQLDWFKLIFKEGKKSI